MFGWLAKIFGQSQTADLNEFRGLFERFQQILKANNRVLELISELEDKFSGEYIFDINYLIHTVDELSETVYLVASNLNVMSGNRYRDLFARQVVIHEELKKILTGHTVSSMGKLVVDYSDLDADVSELTGGKNANLGQIRSHLTMLTPEGFAITTAAYQRFMEENELWPEIKKLYQAHARERRPDGKEYDAAVDRLFERAQVPETVAAAVNKHLASLRSRLKGSPAYAVRSSAFGEDLPGRSFAGRFASFLNCSEEDVLQMYIKVIASRVKHGVFAYGGEKALKEGDLPMAVGVQQMVAARTAGVIYSVEPSGEFPDCLAISATYGLGTGVVGGVTDADYYRVSRLDPTRTVSKRIGRKTTQVIFSPEGGVKTEIVAESLQEKPCLTDAQVVELAESALVLDRFFRRPVDIEWCYDGYGKLYILQCRALRLREKSQDGPSGRAQVPADTPVLLRGRGEVAQRGIAAGRVRQIHEEDDPNDFPMGAIAVTQYTTPQLAVMIRKAAAIITDIGSPTGHMATVAREFGVPMIVNTIDATRLLTDGTDVTVDAEENVVYAGIIKELLEYEAKAEDVYRDLREFRILRQLLRKISPLHLIDPGSSEFTARNCSSYNDIVRFCHEKAVRLLIDLNVSSRRFRGVESRELKLEIPLGLRVIDLGGGFTFEEESAGAASVNQVSCLPMKAVLTGLIAPGAWSTQPMQLGFGDLVSSLTRYSMTDRVARYQGQNLAVISSNYANISLRLGYHFNVIDTYVSENVDDNYIYFRFVGGVTETKRRQLRAVLIKQILEKLNFRVTVSGDLVVARLKKLGIKEVLGVLQEIGRLIGFTRQLDTQMQSEESVAEGLRIFFNRTRDDASAK